MTVGVHCLFAIGCYLDRLRVARQSSLVGRPFRGHALEQRPCGVIPLPMGPFEVVLDFLLHDTCRSPGRPLPRAKGWLSRWSTG